MREKIFIVGLIIITIKIKKNLSTTSDCEISNKSQNNNQTFKDLWGFEHNWFDPEDGWDESKRNLFITWQRRGQYQSKNIPKYTKHGYKKMEIPSKLYELINKIRRDIVFESEIFKHPDIMNSHRLKSDGTIGISSTNITKLPVVCICISAKF